MRRIVTALLAATVLACAMASDAHVPQDQQARPRTVSGRAVHYFTTAIIHSQTPTATGMIQRSTDIIELTGDLRGRVLYHPTSGRIAGPKVRCDLVAVGAGEKTPAGDSVVDYSGTCTFKN